MKFVKTIAGSVRSMFMTEPIIANLVAAGFTAAVAHFSVLKLIDNPDLRNGITLGIIGLAVPAARKQTFSQAGAAALATDVGLQTASQITPEIAGKRNDVPPPAKPIVQESVKEALVNAGVKQAEEITQKVASGLIRRFNPWKKEGAVK